MKIIHNRFIPFRGFAAINLFGVLFVRRGVRMSPALLNHERIHTAQMRELGYVLFYVIYLVEWLLRLLRPGNAYRKLSFESEAYRHEGDLRYLSRRPRFAQWRRHT